jgi:transposase-like protein
MPKTYSKDFRIQVLSCIDRGKNPDEICNFFEIGKTTLLRWIAQAKMQRTDNYNVRGSYSTRKICSITLLELVEKQPDNTLVELAEKFDCCFQAIDKRLRKLKVTRKKNHAVRGEKRAKKTSISG